MISVVPRASNKDEVVICHGLNFEFLNLVVSYHHINTCALTITNVFNESSFVLLQLHGQGHFFEAMS